MHGKISKIYGKSHFLKWNFIGRCDIIALFWYCRKYNFAEKIGTMTASIEKRKPRTKKEKPVRPVSDKFYIDMLMRINDVMPSPENREVVIMMCNYFNGLPVNLDDYSPLSETAYLLLLPEIDRAMERSRAARERSGRQDDASEYAETEYEDQSDAYRSQPSQAEHDYADIESVPYLPAAEELSSDDSTVQYPSDEERDDHAADREEYIGGEVVKEVEDCHSEDFQPVQRPEGECAQCAEKHGDTDGECGGGATRQSEFFSEVCYGDLCHGYGGGDGGKKEEEEEKRGPEHSSADMHEY